MKSKIALVAITSMVALVALEVVAMAHAYDARTSSTIEWKNGKEKFAGRLSSPRRNCKRKRAVSVFKNTDGPDKFIGGDTSNKRGYWSVPQNNPQGEFYAVVKERHRKRYGHSHRCRRGQSADVKVRR